MTSKPLKFSNELELDKIILSESNTSKRLFCLTTDPFIDRKDRKDKPLTPEVSPNKNKEIKDPKTPDDDFSDAFIRIW